MEDWRRNIRANLASGLTGLVHLDEEIAPHTGYRIGGPADAFIQVEEIDDLERIAVFLEKHSGIPWQILGGGTNVLYPEHYSGIVIHPGKAFSNIRKEGGEVTAGAGAELMEVIKHAAGWGLGGMDFAAGIPGSIGGAVKGNAGAFGRSISECVKLVRGFDLKERLVKEFLKEDIAWSYRKTTIPHTLFITEVVLLLRPCPVGECMQEIARTLAERQAKHPHEPSAGCVFVNPDPPKVTAGKLIEELGFKGRRVGDAMCSPQHANFIVNLGKATQSDVLKLIAEIKEAVRKQYGYELREEIKIIKEHNGGF